MSIMTIEFGWYNPRQPKCRNCTYWPGIGMDYGKECTNESFKGTRWRDHNSKACTQFRSQTAIRYEGHYLLVYKNSQSGIEFFMELGPYDDEAQAEQAKIIFDRHHENHYVSSVVYSLEHTHERNRNGK